MKRTIPAILTVLLIVTLAACSPAKVAAKKVVKVGYTLTLADGSVFDKSADGTPLEFMVGGGKMMPAFETALMGMKAGERKTFTLKAADAYGPYDPARIMDIPRAQFGTETPKVGQQFSFQAPTATVVVTVTKVSDTAVTVDANGPLAGKDLTFAVQIVSIRDASKDEIAAAAAASAPLTPQ